MQESSFGKKLKRDLRKHYALYLFLLPAMVCVIIFAYIPMYGVVMAFQNFKPALGIWGSTWVGFDNFFTFFKTYQFADILKNTVSISVYSIVAGFPMPIFLALLTNQLTAKKYKRVLQTVTYMPHFISVVVVVGMLMLFLNPSTGTYGNLMRIFGVDKPPDLLSQPGLFGTVYVLSDIWQHAGWDSIIYLAALASIDVSLYEAAAVDGAKEYQKIWNIDLPSLLPTIIILLILRSGSVMSVGFEKIFLMQNGLNIDASEVISTYVYKVGLVSQRYSFSAAVGLFNSVVNFILLFGVNKISGKCSEITLW